MKKVLFITVIIVFLIGCASSAQKKESSAVYIKADRMYINAKAGISFKVPRGWEQTGSIGDVITFTNKLDKNENPVFITSILTIEISEPVSDNTKDGLKQLLSNGISRADIIKTLDKRKKQRFKSLKQVLHEINGTLPKLYCTADLIFEVPIHRMYGQTWYTDRIILYKIYITPCYNSKKLCYVSFSIGMPERRFYLSYRYDLQKLIDSFLAQYK